MSNILKNKVLIVLFLIILWFVWGTNAWATKIAIATIPPLLMTGICYLIAGTIFICWSAIRHRGINLLFDLKEWKNSIIVGAIMLLGGQGLRSTGEVYLSSGITALIFAIVPLWIVIVGLIYFKKYFSKITILSTTIGLIGLLPIISITIIENDSNNFRGIVFLIGASLFWAVGSSYMAKSNHSKSSLLYNIGKQMLIGGILLSIFGILVGEIDSLDLSNISIQSYLGMIYMILLGTLVGFSLFVWLLHSTSEFVANSFTFVSPIISLTIGAIALNESITLPIIVAAIMIIGSVLSITISNKNKIINNKS